MGKTFYIFLLIIHTFIQISVCEIKKVHIKSHTIVTGKTTTDKVSAIYDNNTSTKGSFYSQERKNIYVDFDLGKDYVIDKILLTLESQLQEISFLVGNLIKGAGGLMYHCSANINIKNTFECIPKCRNTDSSRNGVLSRKILMNLLVKSWVSIYELEVYANLGKLNPNSISENRYVYPDDCGTKSWLLTSPKSKENQLISQRNETKIFLEKDYVITELDVQFKDNIPENLEIQLSNGKNNAVNVIIMLEKCATRKSKYNCLVNRAEFPTRVVVLLSNDVTHISFKGKPVFYPILDVETSKTLKKNLQVTCKIKQCDPSIHSDCSETAMKSGIRFPCSNKRLIRVPTGYELDSFIIVNQGEVEKTWSKTKFAVESNEYDKLTVSMPRNYQYFGQYQCSCLVADEPRTDIKSQITSLAETDFLENLIFKTNVQYKLEESDETYNNSNDNFIIIREKDLKNSFIVLRITAFSLIKNIVMNVSYPKGVSEHESELFETSKPENIKAFSDISQSWSVTTYKYSTEELYPEFFHEKDITLTFLLKKNKLSQKSVIRFIKIDNVTNSKPEMSKIVTKKSISIKAVYTGWDTLKFFATKETCSKSYTKDLSVFGRKTCLKFDPRITCSNHSDRAIVDIKEDRNVATEYKYYIVDKTTNQTLSEIYVNRSVISEEKDMKIKVRYIDIKSNPSNKDITTLEVELTFISKMLEDFIPCGNVLLKITELGKTTKELVMQNEKYKFSVDLKEPFIILSVRIEIDGMNTSIIKELNITNPETLSVKKLDVPETSMLKVRWTGIDKIASALLVGYEVKYITKIVACNETDEKTKFIQATNNNIYQIDLDSLNDKLSLRVTISVQPIFKNNKRGKISQKEKEFKRTGNTKLILDENILSRGKHFTLVPFQSNLPCEIGYVNFQIISPELENVTKAISKVDKWKYKISNLVPGRNYKLTAQIYYQFGEPDVISRPYAFNTSYEISIVKARHVAQVGDKVNISCEADVGPDDKFRKIIEWRRADFSELPEGVTSAHDKAQPNWAFLIMEKSLADFSGDYSCLVKSKTGQGSSQIRIIVNDLIVNPAISIVNFDKTLSPISTKCQSSTIGDGKLFWTDSNNIEIEQTENDKYKIENKTTNNEVIESTLIIKTPSLDTSGVYTCHKSIGEFKSSKIFKLIGEEKLEIITLANSSSFVGEKTRLRCKGQLGMKNQKVVWEIKALMDNNNQNLIKKTYFKSSNISIQDIEITNNLALHKISCMLTPSLNSTSKPIEKTYDIKLFPKIEVDGPEIISSGSSVNLTCVGYPIRTSMILQWVFYHKKSNNSSNSGLVLLSSENISRPNSHDPITLVLPLKDVQDNGTGHYECQFRSQLRSEKFTGKSLRLSVNPNPKALGSEIKKGKNGAERIYFRANSTKSIYLLMIVCIISFLV